MNKKGDEKYLSPWNVLVWIIMVGTIVIGLGIFNSASTDVRPEEARILALRIADCIVEENHLIAEITEDFNIHQACNLNKEMISPSGDFYISITLKDLYTKQETSEKFTLGDKDLEFQCAIKEDEENFAACHTELVYAKNSKNQEIIIEIKTASNHERGSSL